MAEKKITRCFCVCFLCSMGHMQIWWRRHSVVGAEWTVRWRNKKVRKCHDHDNILFRHMSSLYFFKIMWFLLYTRWTLVSHHLPNRKSYTMYAFTQENRREKMLKDAVTAPSTPSHPVNDVWLKSISLTEKALSHLWIPPRDSWLLLLQRLHTWETAL